MSDFYQWREQRESSVLFERLATSPVAYFCMEFALPDNLPIYAGGLGVLAGDYIMEAAQQNFPMVAVGLFYREKCYPGDLGGKCVPNNAEELGLKPVLDKLGNRIIIDMPIAETKVAVQAWYYHKGTVPLYLLDCNLPQNSPEDRDIMRLLYTSDPELRLKQELILGIVGARLLKKLDITPSIYHMNEGHSAFLVYEIASYEMKKHDLSFEDAFRLASRKIAFTNHTLVVGGHDVFDNKLVLNMIRGYASEIGVNPQLLIEKGADKKNHKVFSATFLALNSAAKINAVSALHAREAKKLWPAYQTEAVTNGINIVRWDKIGSGQDLKIAHRKNKKELLRYIRQETGIKWQEHDLLIGWARRIVSYKRPISLFDNLPKIKKILGDKNSPIRLIFSGQPHYQDKEGLWLLAYLRRLAKDELRGNMVFLENYSTGLSSLMNSGCDVWLNTPIVGLEACGTSGMKAALNGVLQFSTNDGWLPEVDLDKIGFRLDDKYINLSLLDIMANRIAPLYYSYQKDSELSPIWGEKMEWSRETILHQFGSDRMLKSYIEKIYLPLLELSK